MSQRKEQAKQKESKGEREREREREEKNVMNEVTTNQARYKRDCQ